MIALQRLVVDPTRLATAGRGLADAHTEASSLLASTRDCVSRAIRSTRGEAAAALAGLVEDWEAQELRHRSQSEQLSSGLSYAARTYEAADNLNAMELQTDLGSEAGAPVKRSAAPAGNATAADPKPTDAVSTPYGELGQWMIQSNGQVANWLGQKQHGKPMYEPINVVLVDKTSTTAQEAARRLNSDLSAAGFPARSVHSTGYKALVLGESYGEQPSGTDKAYSDAWYILPNDHGRVFGPAPSPDGGYVWTAALSKEQLGFNGSIIPTHVYSSFDGARDTFRSALLDQGGTDLGPIAMGNSRDTATATTGDHDGNAVVIQLN